MSKKLKVLIFVSSLISLTGFFVGLDEADRYEPMGARFFESLIMIWASFSIPLIIFLLYALIFKKTK